MGFLARKKKTPNQALQQTGHANDGFAWRHAATRVSRLLSWLFGLGGCLKVIAPSEDAVKVLRTLSHTGFAYAPSKAVCEAAGWGLVDDEFDLGYIRYAMRLETDSDQRRLLSVRIAEAGKPPWAFVPLFYFEEYEKSREPFDCAFHTLTEHLAGFVGTASRMGSYSYPHRAGWMYSFAGWVLSDATLVLVQDELDIQFGMDVTLWVQPTGTMIEAPVQYE